MPQPESTGTGIQAEAVVPDGRFWAKLHPRDAPTTYHPLLAHSADVAAVLRRLLQPDSVLADRVARSANTKTMSAGFAAQLVYAAALHDMGKVNHSFQDQWRARAGSSKGHVQVVLASLGYRPLQQVWLEILSPLALPRREAHELLRTGICHHGRPWDPAPNPTVPIWLEDARRSPLAEIRRLARLGREWSALDAVEGDEGFALTPRFLHLFAGALTLADWIGSTTSAFPFDPAAEDDPHGYWTETQNRAGWACAAIGLTPKTAVASLAGLPLLERIFPLVFGAQRPEHLAGAKPTPLQERVATMELPTPGSRVLMESETGSGKTEAALALYARLRAAGHVGGLVFALPTRATATAMHARVAAAMEAMYEPGAGPTLALAMGGDQARIEVADSGVAGGDLVEDTPDTYPDTAERELVRWSSSSAKKYFAAEIVVGTLDQLLLGGLAVKHAHLRLAAFSRQLLVIDELHSYDRYMAEVLRRVLDVNSDAGGVAVLMSATLSDRERLRVGGLIQSDDEEQSPFDEAVDRPYPVLSITGRTGQPWTDIELKAASGSTKPPLHWRLCGESTGLEAAIRAARAGARVCILRSTVKGARRTVSALVEDYEAGRLLWSPGHTVHTPAYHSRYTLADRMALDRGVLRSYGRGGSAGDGRILVATQVAEQSLDVDFDIMVTDLCPVDVLLQRLGRVWRHRERDPARPEVCRGAQAWIIEPEGGLEPFLVRDFGGENGWGSVYAHLGFLELTRRTILERSVVAVPVENRRLIESVYHADLLDALRNSSEVWQAHFDKQEGRSFSHELTAKGVMIRFDDTYLANADRFQRDLAGVVRTRLGDDRVRVGLPRPLAGIFNPKGQADSVDLPFLLLQRAGVDLEEPRAVGGSAVGHFVEYGIGDLAFRYGPQGWEW